MTFRTLYQSLYLRLNIKEPNTKKFIKFHHSLHPALKHKNMLEIPNLNLCNPQTSPELQFEPRLSRGIWKLKSQIRFGQIRITSWKSGRGGYEDLRCSTRRPCH